MMTGEDWMAAALDDGWLTLDELCRLSAAPPQWVRLRVEEGLLVCGGSGAAPEAWRFDAVALARVRRMRRMERDFGAAPELAALVVDLEEEIGRLRGRLLRAGLA